MSCEMPSKGMKNFWFVATSNCSKLNLISSLFYEYLTIANTSTILFHWVLIVLFFYILSFNWNCFLLVGNLVKNSLQYTLPFIPTYSLPKMVYYFIDSRKLIIPNNIRRVANITIFFIYLISPDCDKFKRFLYQK